jgi:hypothetical protein
MTKKHFIAIARAIKYQKDGGADAATLYAVAAALCREFKAINTRFEMERFMIACGF